MAANTGPGSAGGQENRGRAGGEREGDRIAESVREEDLERGEDDVARTKTEHALAVDFQV
jgi:hypothetical protein